MDICFIIYNVTNKTYLISQKFQFPGKLVQYYNNNYYQLSGKVSLLCIAVHSCQLALDL